MIARLHTLVVPVDELEAARQVLHDYDAAEDPALFESFVAERGQRWLDWLGSRRVTPRPHPRLRQ